ncbi:MAG: response regulator [Spirochaetales bacterium]|nr:response regulator [Spirochaetales bacterium]
MSKETILVIEDEKDIRELITYNLNREGYKATGAADGTKALLAIGAHTPDLIVLDLMLPGIDGLDLCRQLKANENTVQIPIIMVTAKGEEEDIIKGLEMGADDYITKPFSPKILAARVKAVLRRKQQEKLEVEIKEKSIHVHNLLIDPAKHKVLIEDKEVELTLTEFRILYYLASKPGWVCTRYQIVEATRGKDYFVTDRSVDVLIFGLRNKMGKYGSYIETVRGIGYRFKE